MYVLAPSGPCVFIVNASEYIPHYRQTQRGATHHLQPQKGAERACVHATMKFRLHFFLGPGIRLMLVNLKVAIMVAYLFIHLFMSMSMDLTLLVGRPRLARL